MKCVASKHWPRKLVTQIVLQGCVLIYLVEKVLPTGGFVGFGALVHGEVCGELSVDCFKEDKKQIEFCRFFAANFAAYPNYILTQKLRRQNFASKNLPTKSRQLFAFDK